MAFDSEVSFGIFGETNLDEVGDSIERGLQNAAEGTQKAAAGAESMEKSIDSATEAVASLGVASENADEQLEDVEDELEDIVTDAGKATASVNVLNASLMGVEDVSDLDIDIDFEDDIDAINESWREMRNEIDEFEHRVDDVLPRGAAGSPIDDFLGDQKKFQDTLDTLDEVDDTMDSIADERTRALGGGDGGPDPFRQLPPGLGRDRATRSRIINQLDFDDTDGGLRQGPANVGRLLSQTDQRGLGKLAGSIAEIDEVASSQQDVMRALDKEVISGPGPAMDMADTDAIVPFGERRDAVAEGMRQAQEARSARIGRMQDLMGGRDVFRGMEPMPMGSGVDERGGLPRAMDQVTDSVKDGFTDALHETDLVDAPALPAPDQEVTGPADVMGGRVGAVGRPSDAFDDDIHRRTPAVGRGSLSGIIPTTETEVPGEDEETERVFADLADFDVEERGRLVSRGRADFSDIVDPMRKELNFTVDELEDFKDTTDETTDSTSRLNRAMNRARDRVSSFTTRARDRVRSGVRGGMRGDIMDLRAGDGPDRSTRRFRDALGDLSETAVRTNTSLGFLMGTMNLFAGNATGAKHAVDELDDEVEELSQSLAVLGSGFQNLSANLGPFNISLSNLLITIPLLLAAIGPLVATMAGLAGAAVVVAGAFASILAVGALGFTEKLQENFAGINSTMKAVQAIAKGMKRSILEAIEPLKDVEIGGVGPSGIFVTVLQDIVTLINMFAKAMAALLEMDVVEDFLLRLRAAVLGFSEETEGGMTMIEGLKQLMKGALPILGDFLVWLIDVTPEFLAFVGTITRKAAPALSSLAQSFLELSVLLTEVGTGAFNVLLPALALVIDVVTGLLSILVAVEGELGVISDILIAVGGSGIFLAIAMAKAVMAFNKAMKFAYLAQIAMGQLNKVMKMLNTTALTTSKRMMIVAGRLFVLGAGIYLVLDALGLLEPLLDGINAVLDPLASTLTDFRMGLGISSDAADKLTRVLKGLVGMFLIASYVISTVYGTSIAYASGLMLGFTGSAIGGAIAGLSAFLTEIILTTGGLWGLISAETTATIASQGFTGALYSAAAGVTALQVAMSAGILAAIVAMVVGLKYIADNFGVMEAVAVGVISAIGAAFAGLVASVVVGAGVMASALIATGVGAIIVGIGIAILLVMKHWDALKAAFVNGAEAIASAAGDAWDKVVNFVDPDPNLDWLYNIESTMDRIVDLGWSVINWFKKLVTNPLAALGDAWQFIWDGIEWIIKNLGGNVPDSPDDLIPGRGVAGGDSGGLGGAFVRGAATGGIFGGAFGGIGALPGAAIGGTANAISEGLFGRSLNTGGYVEEDGYAYLHSDEWVIPQDDLERLAGGADTGVDMGRKSSPNVSGEQQGTSVNVQIDNSGGGRIDDRRARQIARITNRTMNNRMRREDGR